MKIKKLQLKNGYKRFYDLTIDLGDTPKRIVALIGPNGCGKSSVLDGMLFHNNNLYGHIGVFGDKDYTYHSMTKDSNYSHKNIVIDFDEGSFAEVREKKRKSGNENTIFSFRSSYRYNSSLKLTQSHATSDIKLNDYGATTANDIDDKMTENYRRLYIKYNDYLEKEDCRPSEAKAKIIRYLNDSLENCLDLEITSIGNIESNQGTLYFIKSDHQTEFEFNVLSSGEKEVVDIILDLYLRQDEYSDTIFLIDEPELHISANIQKNLLIEIDKLVGNRCQIWIATHSIGFMRALQENFNDDCQIIYFKPEIKWAAEPQKLEPMKMTALKWKEVFETALGDLSELVSPKRIVYCEGKDKPKANGQDDGFDAKVLNGIFGEKYGDTLFISSGGNTELDQRSGIAIDILKKVMLDLEILVFKDRDSFSGKQTNEECRQKYLENSPKHFRMMKRREIENYLFDKEVLKAYCKNNGKKFDESKYNEVVSDIVNNDVKVETGRIKEMCDITESISQNKFKLALSEFIEESMDVYKELESCIFDRK